MGTGNDQIETGGVAKTGAQRLIAIDSRWLLALTLLLSVSIALFAWQAVDGGDGLEQKLGRLMLYLTPLPLVLLLSRRFPAERGLPLFGVGMLQDFGYFVLIIVFRIVFTALFITAVAALYQQHLDFLTLHIGEGWPLWLRVLVAWLFSDLLAWFHHFVRHHIGAFWLFHKVHHSQRQLNYFSDFRMHPVDFVIANLIIILPQLMVQVDAPTIVLIGILVQWHTMIYHSNLRSNYGLLRFLLVTPQSHRIHHSRLARHHDRNFGVILSVWDHLFGTQYRNYGEYPETGVEAEFPVERSVADVVRLKPLMQQFVTPFQQLFNRSF